MTESNLIRVLRMGIVFSMITASPAFAGRIIVKPPVTPAPTPTPTPDPIPTTPPSDPQVEQAEMEFAITPFSNMEHGWHIFEPGYRAVCTDSSGVVATAKLSIDAAVNGETTDGRGAYQALIIRPVAQYLRRGATSGSCELSICLDQNVDQAGSAASCRDVRSVVGGDQDRALSYKNQASYKISGNKISLQSGAPGLSAWHPAFGFAAPGKSFKDYQSPLVLDMNGDGKLALSDVWGDKNPIRFDMALEGRDFPTGWVKAEDALLVIDNNKNGKIDNASELFGEYTNAGIMEPKTFKNGFNALAQFDSNKDGTVDSRDRDFARIQLWFDRNQNGRTDKGELVSLASQGLKSLNLVFKDLRDGGGNYPLVSGNEVRLTGSFTKTDGRTYQMADVWFKVRRNYDQATAMTKWLMAPVK